MVEASAADRIHRSTRGLPRVLSIIAITGALAACTGTMEQDEPPVADHTTATQGASQPVPLKGYTEEQTLERVRNDLAERLVVPVDRIQVASVQSVEWADNSLGCPVPGQAYQPIRSKGWVITLDTPGPQIIYHADRYQAIPCPPIAAE